MRSPSLAYIQVAENQLLRQPEFDAGNAVCNFARNEFDAPQRALMIGEGTALGGNVENLRLDGANAIKGNGNSLDNGLTGNGCG